MKLQLIVAIGLAVMASQTLAADTVTLKDQKDKASYSIGLNIGKNFKSDGLEISTEALFAGFKDGLSGAKAQLTDEEMAAVMQTLQKEMQGKQAEIQAKQELAMKNSGVLNQKEGAAFLAENKKKEGVKTTASGLQYKVITEGKGPKPKASDTVTTHYKGTLISGKEFDSSYKRGEPMSFEVGGVIPGWTEALQLMSEGSKYQLFIPSGLAYGERGAGRDIGPNSTLIFEVELIKIGK